MNIDSEEYQYYRDREDWSDISPICQNEHERIVCKIDYSSKFIDVYNFIRAVMSKDERSERALKLTEDALNLNPANYSVWYYRRNNLKDLKSNLSYELNFVAGLIDDNPKNYQVWYHRQWIVDELSRSGADTKQMIENEFVFIDALLIEESKNYHVWQYRNWLVNHFKVWDYELTFTSTMLEKDCLNNSAWNHRYYSIHAISGFTDNIIEQETDFVFQHIRKAPENESAWNYLGGLYRGKDLSTQSGLRTFCEEVAHNDANADKSPYLHSFLLDLNLSTLRHAGRPATGDSKMEELLQACVATCKLLGHTLDKVRVNYWTYRLDQIINEFGSAVTPSD